MPEAGITVEPQRLGKAGDTRKQPDEKLQAAVRSFMTNISGIGDRPWGTGSLGQAFENAYGQSNVGDVLAPVHNLGDGVGTTATRVQLMAIQYGYAGQANSQ